MKSLGGKCELCGFADCRALEIHHRNGDGREERERLGGSSLTYYRQMLSHLEDYQLLCANCYRILTRGKFPESVS